MLHMYNKNIKGDNVCECSVFIYGWRLPTYIMMIRNPLIG